MNKKDNPYTLMFGMEPHESISRTVQKEEVFQSFRTGMPPQQIYMITGVRGCGKTVFMTEVENDFRKDDQWIVVDLNSSRDMLEDLVSILGNQNSLIGIFKRANINLSVFGIGFEVNNSAPITNIQVALIKMLESLKKHGKKVLITIDEVTVTEHMREFASAFQLLGYCVWNAAGDFNEALKEYKACLEEYVYEKIWSGLSRNDKKMAYGIAKSKAGKASDIKRVIDMSNGNYCKYRERLIKNGFVDGSKYGVLSFSLPFFGEYAIREYEETLN